MRKLNLTGQRFGRLLVVSPNGGKWLCICECGHFKTVLGKLLRDGRTTSCGCFHREVVSRIGKSNATHGQSSSGSTRKPSPLYVTWVGMRNRCNNPKDRYFHAYGARGIRVCDYWDTFKNFAEDMGERPKGHSIDRINPDGHYVPSNCRWATAKEQAQNRRKKCAL